MAQPPTNDFDLMRTRAWLADVAMACGTRNQPASIDELINWNWINPHETDKMKREPDFSFAKWDRGDHAVSLESVEKIALCLEFEEKEPCNDVFLHGPGGLPFWILLSDEVEGYPEAVCSHVIGDWLYPPERGMELKRHAFFGKSFEKKIEQLWASLLGNIPVDFDGYDSGEQGHALINLIRTDRLKPSLDLFAVFLAVRQLAERRKECRDQARYFSEACFGMLDLFKPWKIKNVVAGILDSWYAPCNPVAIAIIDRHESKSGTPHQFSTPSTAGESFRQFAKTLNK